ncbi:MAG: PGPGW domain-containing protein [Acidimicrobiales bacterium]
MNTPPLDPEGFHPDNHDASNPADPAHPEHPEHPTFRERFDEFIDRIEDAAIQAEYATGVRESSDEEARAGALKRIARMTLGFLVTIIGIAALPLPGPGWLIIAGGLTILSKDVAWADRLLRYIRRRVPGIPEDGKIPRSSMITIGVMTLAAISASLWWSLARGSDAIQAGTYPVDEVEATADSMREALGRAISVELGDDGPLVVAIDGCEPISFEVTERSKTSFSLGAASGSCPAADDVINAFSDATVELGYATDGLVAWFFADDHLDTLSVGDVTIGVVSIGS